MTRREVDTFQPAIIKSYKQKGGYAAKWNDMYAKGKPDLVGCFESVGVHLIEVKHRPEWVMGRSVGNPMEKRQITEARRWIKTGGLFVLMVAFGSSGLRGSRLGIYDPLADQVCFNEHNSVPYVLSRKYDVHKLVKEYLERSQK